MKNEKNTNKEHEDQDPIDWTGIDLDIFQTEDQDPIDLAVLVVEETLKAEEDDLSILELVGKIANISRQPDRHIIDEVLAPGSRIYNQETGRTFFVLLGAVISDDGQKATVFGFYTDDPKWMDWNAIAVEEIGTVWNKIDSKGTVL